MVSLFDDKFTANLSVLKEYQEEEGHCNVPQIYKKIRSLQLTWVNYQRRKYKQGTLNNERIEQLEDRHGIVDAFSIWRDIRAFLLEKRKLQYGDEVVSMNTIFSKQFI